MGNTHRNKGEPCPSAVYLLVGKTGSSQRRRQEAGKWPKGEGPCFGQSGILNKVTLMWKQVLREGQSILDKKG